MKLPPLREPAMVERGTSPLTTQAGWPWGPRRVKTHPDQQKPKTLTPPRRVSVEQMPPMGCSS